jgi:hypothetical protein
VTQKARDEIVDRAMSDATFRALLLTDPVKALADYDLTPEERAMFQSGTTRAERLEDRISKSDIAATVAVKTSSPTIHAPSQKTRRR